jgi:hypothetical protein
VTGFRLDSLLKLAETKARNNQTTLLHYLAGLILDKTPELSKFGEEIRSVDTVSKCKRNERERKKERKRTERKRERKRESKSCFF